MVLGVKRTNVPFNILARTSLVEKARMALAPAAACTSRISPILPARLIRAEPFSRWAKTVLVPEKISREDRKTLRMFEKKINPANYPLTLKFNKNMDDTKKKNS